MRKRVKICRKPVLHCISYRYTTRYYRTVRDIVLQHKNHIIMILTPPISSNIQHYVILNLDFDLVLNTHVLTKQ